MTIYIKKCKDWGTKALKIRNDKDKEKEENVIWSPNYTVGLYLDYMFYQTGSVIKMSKRSSVLLSSW